MAQQIALMPMPQAEVLTPEGRFSVPWFNFFRGFANAIVQIGDCIVLAGPLRSGYLACNGAAVSRTTYAALFAVIGTTFGVGDGVTTFNLPLFATPGAPAFWVIHYQ